MEKKLFLLDALALIYRAYYGLIKAPRITSKGKNMNAQFGFTNTLLDILNKEKPTHLAVCFDTHAPTDRHIDFEAYKANRQETPEDLLESIPDIKRLLAAFNITCLELDGFEADDIIGTLAWKASAMGFDVFMVTPDKDYGQLLTSTNLFIYKPPIRDYPAEIVDAAGICAKWDIAYVGQVVDILGLMGDTADNIPGIKGVGEKTAAKLLKEYGSLENVLENAATIKGSLGEKIRAGKEDAIMSKKLATIITEVPLKFEEEACVLKEWNKEALKLLFEEFEFKTLSKRILSEEKPIEQAAPLQGGQMNLFETSNSVSQKEENEEQIPQTIKENNPGQFFNIDNTPHTYHTLIEESDILQFIENAKTQHEICFDTETTHIEANLAELVGMSFSYLPGEAYYVPCPKNMEETKMLLEKFDVLFGSPSIKWIGQNIKYDLLLLKWYGFSLTGDVYDTMLAHYLCEPEARHNMNIMSETYLSYSPIEITTLIGKKGKEQGNMRDVAIKDIAVYAAEDADITLQIKHKLAPEIIEKGLEKVLDTVENPLVKVLTDMEFEGVRIDMDFLKSYSSVLETQAKQYEESVYEQAGVRFNLASPKQLGDVLFEKLKLETNTKISKTKTGQYATGEDVLQKLAHKYPIVENILGFRELTKLRSTYIDALPQLVNPKTGRVHTTYSQAVAVTGRLSSNNPNLQNIPIRTDKGKEIRKAFIPREGNVMISADYSQIELRIMAALSGDANMCAAFKNGKDIHTATASKIYGIPEEEVNKEQRYKAKSVNFGIIYGQGAFGLAENLGITRNEAKNIIDNYKSEFPGVMSYMETMKSNAKEKGYVETLMGRKRWLRDINSANFNVRGFAERNAVNSPIQGTAADMIKLAMIDIHKKMKLVGMKSKMILQVHDELVFDAFPEEVEELEHIILTGMKNALPLPNGVPVEAELGKGQNWLEAH